MSQLVQDLDLLTDQTTPSTGKVLPAGSVDTIVVHVDGDSTSFSLTFQGCLRDGKFFDIEGRKKSDLSASAKTITSVGDAWEIDGACLIGFRANLTSISNGSISVYANAI